MGAVLVVAAAILGYALFSRQLATSAITAPMVFTGVGLLVGNGVFGIVELALDSESVTILVEAALVIVLFTDAVRIDPRVLREEGSLPARMLVIGLPLTVIAGAGIAWLMFGELGVLGALLLSAVLAPTDAALGRAVVNDERLPARVRQTVNVESGLNDGIMLPAVTILLALAIAESESATTAEWAIFTAEQIGFGLVVGALIGYLGSRALCGQASRGAVDGVYLQLGVIAVAAGAYAGADLVGGNGFVAAFTGGLAFQIASPSRINEVADFAEDEAELLSAITFLIFGAAIAGSRLDDFTWLMLGYAIISLTVVRMVPVLIALASSGTRFETRLFLGWFGPRGLATILFALLVAEEAAGQYDVVVDTAILTVLVSVFAHGLSASAWSTRLAAVIAAGDHTMAEMQPVDDQRPRRTLD